MSKDQPATVRRHRAIWISDIHLGTKHAQVEPLLEFLRLNEADHLYIVGDLIDGWELRRAWRWEDSYNTLIQKILRKNRKGTKVTYIAGNHDEFLEHYVGLRFGGVKLVRQAYHRGADGRRYLVIHGHQFDGLTHFNRLLERVGARLYNIILDLNHWMNRVRRQFGFGYWSVAAYLKHKAKSSVKFITQYENAMTSLAHLRKVDGIICGHIHRAEMRPIDGLRYFNCGDWVESCTALIEDFAGNFELIHYHHENPVHRPRRRPRAHDPGARVSRDPVELGA
ncbi:UDP-2,3-diacylglucosamine diphosphatase [bacterium]|nr:UDP-2,3-diacylglucosamine diphosphatase [bacterium]